MTGEKMSGFTKEIIIRTLFELLNEKPLAKITVKDIVERCGVNRNTFYYHFRDISDVVESALLREVDNAFEHPVEVDSMLECLEVLVKLPFDNDIISGKVLKQYLEEKIWKNRFAQVIEVDTLLMMIESKLDFKFSYGKTSFKDAALIRQAVFVEEQGFEKEFDKLDNTAYHLVIYKDEQPIAVGRMYFKDKTTMILGRIAALKEYRGQKLGSKVVTALENKARELGCLETELSAQQQAQKFYEKLGYKPDGDMYYDEWCPHVTMKKIL